MAYSIVISSFARDNAYEAYEWYENQVEGLGEAFLLELSKAYEIIAKNPNYFSFIDEKKELRDVLIHRFPFLIVFSINNDSVEIIAIHHAKKHPNKKYGGKI